MITAVGDASGYRQAMAFVHPALGTLTILMALWVGSLGLTARQGKKNATRARRSHRKYAPWALFAMVVSGTTGTASTLWVRPDLTLGETLHLAVGIASITSMAVAAVLTRSFTNNPMLRTVHPFLGVLSVAGGIIQGILGIELLP